MTTKNAKTVLFASLIAAMILPLSSTDMASAEVSSDIEIKEYEQKALRDNEVSADKLLKRVGDKWLSSYKDTRHFNTSEEAVNKFVERNSMKEGLNKENAKLISKIHNFETITESVGSGHEIVLLIAELQKAKGKYNPSEPVSKYHDWIANQYTVPTTKQGIKDRLTEILGDEKFVNLAKKHAKNFNKLSELGSVPLDLVISDEDYWGEIGHIAQCERDVNCDVNLLKHQPGATAEEIEKIQQLEAQVNDVSFDLWDLILPNAHATWKQTFVSSNLYAKIQLESCYYQNCVETWQEYPSGPQVIDHDSYGSPNLEHVYRDSSMYFYGRNCDAYSGSQAIINKVTTTPYLAQVLKTNLSDSDTKINTCAVGYHYDSSSSHDWMVGIKVDTPGSYYWVWIP